ncbi:MAG: hypothetical protein AB7T31_03250 [Gemmatimonadales bacterium]
MSKFIYAATALALCACAAAESDSFPTELPLLTASAPTLEIGVVEGDPAYSFANISAAFRLDDGGVAVADAGNTRISLFDADGAAVRSWGSRGEGPGEFRTLSRIYPHGPDSLMAADLTTSRVSVFGLDGELGRELDGIQLSADTTFRLDSWLYGRFWVDGALTAASRSDVRGTLDRLPPPRDPPGYRTVRVARSGDLWIREGEGATPDVITWLRVATDGRPSAVVELPARFSPLDLSGDDVLGVWLDESDVNFVRVYRVAESGTTRPVPAWLVTTDSVRVSPPGPTDAELRDLMRQSIRGMAMAQEIHYSSHLTYTTAIDSLEFERPTDLGISFTHANARGWAAVFTHASVDRLCALAYGFGTPPGWSPGGMLCGPESAPAVARP